MKLKRMKLVALAMSALMVTSALPVTAFAEEEVFYEEVADEVLVGESAEEEFYFDDEAAFEEEAADFVIEEDSYEEAVGAAEHGTSTDENPAPSTKQWDGNDPVQDGDKWVINVIIYENGVEVDSEKQEVKGTTRIVTPAQCGVAGEAQTSFAKKDDVGFDFGTKTVSTVIPAVEGDHVFKRVNKDWGEFENKKCDPNASYTYTKKCEKCGYTEEGATASASNGESDDPEDDQFEANDWIAHDIDSAITVVIDKNSLDNLRLKDANKVTFSSLADAKANVELIKNTKKGSFDVTIQKYCKKCKTTRYFNSKGEVVPDGEVEKIVIVPAEYRDYKYAEVVELLPDADNDLNPGIPNVRGLVEGSNTEGYVNGAGQKVLFKDDFMGAHSDDPGALIDKNGNLKDGVLERLALADCGVAGSYKVAYKDDDDDIIAYSEWIEIPAHHVYGLPVFEFAKAADYSKCIAILNGSKTKVDHFETECVNNINYETVYHCMSFGKCSLKDCKVATVYSTVDGEELTADELSRVGSKVDPAKTIKATAQKTIHTYAKAKDKIQYLIDQAAIKGTKVDLNEVEALILVDPTGKTTPRTDLIDKDVRIKNNNICDGGTVTVEYVCKKCGNVHSVDIEVGARSHLKGDLIMKVEKEPTCTETGKNVATANCVYCGKELDRKENIIAKKPHSNQEEYTVVGDDGKKQIKVRDKVSDEYAWSHALIGANGSVVVGPRTILQRNGKVVFNSNGTSVLGVGTSIGTNTTGAQTSEDEFLGVQFYLYTVCEWCGEYHAAVRPLDADDEFTVVVNSAIPGQPNDTAGTITLTATYKHDNRTVSMGPVTYPWYQSWASYAARSDGNKTDEAGNPDTHVHKEGIAEVQNLVEATCDKAGSYDLVSKCTECGEVVSTLHVITAATGHDFGAWKTSSRATVFAAGKQTRTCARCKKTETKSLAKLPSIIKLNKTAVTVKVGKSATVKVSKWNLKDYIAPTAENGVVSANKNVATAFKTGSYLLKIKGKKAGSTTVTVKMKAGATAQIKVTVKK